MPSEQMETTMTYYSPKDYYEHLQAYALARNCQPVPSRNNPGKMHDFVNLKYLHKFQHGVPKEWRDKPSSLELSPAKLSWLDDQLAAGFKALTLEPPTTTMTLDLHGFHPDMIHRGFLFLIVKEVWQRGISELVLIHGHGRDKCSPGFVNTKTGYFGLSIRKALKGKLDDDDCDYRPYIKVSTLDCSDKGLTSVKMQRNPSPNRTAFDSGLMGTPYPATLENCWQRPDFVESMFWSNEHEVAAA